MGNIGCCNGEGNTKDTFNIEIVDRKGVILDAPTAEMFAQTLWPALAKITEGVVINEILPKVNESSPVSLSITKFSIGTIPPVFGALRISEPEFPYRLRGVLPVQWHSDQELSLVVLGLPVGVKDLKIDATLIVDNGPLLDKPPLIGGFSLTMPDIPKIEFDLTGIANLAEIPGVRGYIMTMIESFFANKLVLPNRVAYALGDIANGVDPASVRNPPPMGLLKVKVYSAKNLPSEDWLDESDPFAQIMVGYFSKQWRSKEKTDTKNPVWDEKEQVFACFSLYQKLQVHIMDQDIVSANDFVADVGNVQVRDVIQKVGRKDYPLFKKDGSEIPGASVNMGFDWLVLKSYTAKPTGPDDGLFVLSFAVDVLHPMKAQELKEDYEIDIRIPLDNDEVLFKQIKSQPRQAESDRDTEILERILKKMEEKKMSDKEAAEITGLSLEEIAKIRKSDTVTIVTEYQVHHQVHFTLTKKQFETKKLQIKIASKEINDSLELALAPNLAKDDLHRTRFRMKGGAVLVGRLLLFETGPLD